MEKSYFVGMQGRVRLQGHTDKGGIMNKEFDHLVGKMDRAQLVEFVRLVRLALYRQAKRERSQSSVDAQTQEDGRKGLQSRA